MVYTLRPILSIVLKLSRPLTDKVNRKESFEQIYDDMKTFIVSAEFKALSTMRPPHETAKLY